MKKIAFEVNMAPVAKKSAKPVIFGDRAGLRRDDAEREDARTFASLALAHAPPVRFEGPLRVSFTFRVELAAGRAKTWEGAAAAAGVILPTSRPDVDNYVKFAFDALTRSKRFWKDDAQVIKLEATKEYASEPSVLVEIEELVHVASCAEWKGWKAQKDRAVLSGDGPLVAPEERESATLWKGVA